MAQEPWNKVNIPFPSAVCCSRIPVGKTTGPLVKHVLGGINKILILLQSEILQTEIRLLYELLYVLNNNLGRSKTIRVLKQVEQCTNRLKMMKLDVALQDLKDLCPRNSDLNQRIMGIESGECNVPSQPMLEWICLKVLGAAKLMPCAMNHCTRAFILSKQNLKTRDFVVVHVVIHCMLSRLWVFFRGLLVHLAPLYQHLLRLLRVVSQVRPMPFLTDFSLPVDMARFLGPSFASLLTIKVPSTKAIRVPSTKAILRHAPCYDRQKRAVRTKAVKKKPLKKKAVKKKAVEKKAVKKKAVEREDVWMNYRPTTEERRQWLEELGLDVRRKNVKPTWKERRQWREELGLVVERGVVKRAKISTIIDTKALLKIFSDFTEVSTKERSSSQDPAEIDQKTMFKNRVKAATTFADMATHFEEMIPWCKSQNLQQEKRCFAFLHLKCQKMKCLESAGYNVQRKLRRFKQEVCWASSPRGSIPRTCLPVAALWRSARRRTRFQPIRARARPTTAGVCVKRKRSQRQKKRTELSALEEEQGSDEAGTSASRTSPEFTPQTSACVNEDEIDDIFASIGF